jgi:hypothetical protein
MLQLSAAHGPKTLESKVCEAVREEVRALVYKVAWEGNGWGLGAPSTRACSRILVSIYMILMVHE